MASVNYAAKQYIADGSFPSASGMLESRDYQTDGFAVQPIPTAAAPLTRYKVRGLYAGAPETWVTSYTPMSPPPSGHATTETGHTKT